jgi:hypothetical protein
MFLELNNFPGAMKVQVASRCPPGHQAMSGRARVTGHVASYWIYRPFCMARTGVAHSMHLACAG